MGIFYLLFDLEGNGVQSSNSGLVRLASLVCIFAPQLLGSPDLVGNVTTYCRHVLLAQPLELLV